MEIQKLKKKILQEERQRKKISDKNRHRKLILGAGFLVLLLSCAGFLYHRNLDAILEGQFARGEELLERGEYSRAYSRFRGIYEGHPRFRRSAEALFLSGEILQFHLHRDNEALLAYLLVERDYPGRSESYRAQRRAAEIYKYRLKDYDRALMTYQKLLENSITDGARIQYEIADTYFRQNNIEQARIEMETVLKNFPGSPLVPEALFRIAAIFALEGSLQDAEFIYCKVMEEYPESPFAIESRFGLVSVLERKGELRAALSNLETLRGNYPKPGVIDKKIRQIKERIQKKKKAI
jgi:TolA-binding protein